METRDDAIVWIIRDQFARRNLTPFQRAELALKLEGGLAAQAKERQRGGRGGVLLVANLPQGNDDTKTRDKIAVEAGVSAGTIHAARSGAVAISKAARSANEARSESIKAHPRAGRKLTSKLASPVQRCTALVEPKRERALLAAEAGVSPRTMAAALSLHGKAPELFEKVRAGELSLPKAANAAKLAEKRALASPADYRNRGDRRYSLRHGRLNSAACRAGALQEGESPVDSVARDRGGVCLRGCVG